MSRTTVTFDGHALTDDYRVSDLQVSLLPRSIGTAKVPGRDGTIFTGANLEEKTITLTLTALGRDVRDRQEAGRALASILAVGEPRPLALSIDGGLYYMAIPSSKGDISRFMNADRFEVEFTVPDPVMHGASRTVTVPSGGSVTFQVGGTYPTMPVISAPQAANNSSIHAWRLRLDNDSYVIATIPSGVSSAPVIADCAQRTLRVNGTVTLLRPEADWLVLEPGSHTLAMTGTGEATVTFEERWL